MTFEVIKQEALLLGGSTDVSNCRYYKINLCNHIGLLRTDGAPMLHEVRLYNSSEQTGTAHHFYSLCSSSIWTGKISISRILENNFEAHDWTCEFYQATGLSVHTAFKRWINLSSMLINALFQIRIFQLWLFQIVVWIGRRVFYTVKAHIWNYYTFSGYLSVWGRILLKIHKTKQWSRLIPKDDMRVSLSTTVPRMSDIVHRKQAQKYHWVTGWLKLFVIFH